MLLTLKPPLHNDIKTPHDFSHHTPSYQSPRMIPSGLPPPGSESTGRRMSNPHRGLPPPSAMSLPPPERPPADRALPGMAPLGQLPAPPQQWQGQDESMRNWLAAKVEEDRRRQEEERTRQEGLRLDQRKIEQTMLRESLSGGIPPVMVPLIFAGMGGGSLPNTALEWAQHYLSQMSLQSQPPQQQQQQQPAQASAQAPLPAPPQQHALPVEIRRGDRMIPPNPYGAQQPLQPAPHTQNAPAIPAQSSQTAYARQGPTSAPRHQPQSLPALNTGELHGQGPSGGQQSMHAIQHGQGAPQEAQQASSPSIYFHHWVPPNQNNPPATPSSKSQHGSPFSHSQQSHLRSEYQNSPKKRKATGTHQAPPPPTSQPADRSPPYSQGSSAGTEERREGRHSRQHSATSSTRGYDVAPRPSSRQQRQEAMSGSSTERPGSHYSNKPPTPTMSTAEPSSQPEIRHYDQSRYAPPMEMRHHVPPPSSLPKRED